MNTPETTSTDCLIDKAVEAEATVACPPEDKRQGDRLAYAMSARLMLLLPDGKPGAMHEVHGIDLSEGGMLVEGRSMFHPGAVGGIELTRSDGSHVVVGVRVCHSRYASRMLHKTGLQFIPLPKQIHATLPWR